MLASGNAGKQKEIAAILAGDEILSLAAFPAIVLPEEGDDYEQNACTKARTVALATGLPSLADDSGLEVDALGGRPGVFSARYGGPGLDDRARMERLLEALSDVAEPRVARFVCLAACALPDGRTFTARGLCEGRILRSPRGEGGFGYDPIFAPQSSDRTCAELDPAEKDRISHRGEAFRALARLLPELT